MPHQCLQDPDIDALIARMETRIDPGLQPITAPAMPA
jgi:2-methylcitrate dehydratase PrpD